MSRPPAWYFGPGSRAGSPRFAGDFFVAMA